MKHNRMKRVMACVLCIMVLMSSSCAMAGRVDAQEPMLLEDHAVPTTDEMDGVSEDAEAEIMLLQEDGSSEAEGAHEDAVPVEEEETAPEENTTSQEESEPTDHEENIEGSQDVSNEQENVSGDQQTEPTEDISGGDQQEVPGEENGDTQETPDTNTSDNETEPPSSDNTETPGDQTPDDTQIPADDPTSGDENNNDQTEEDKTPGDTTTGDGVQDPDSDVTDEDSKDETAGDVANPDAPTLPEQPDAPALDTTDPAPENPDNEITEDTTLNPDGEITEDTLLHPDGESDSDVQEGTLTEEEQQQVEDVIALIEALPTMEEIAERFAALEEAEDEEGYAAYYQELCAQVTEAQEAYDALSEAQKEAVTNAEILEQFEWLWSDTLEEGNSIWGALEDDSAYVNEIKITNIQDGVAPFDFHQHDPEKCYNNGKLICGLNAYEAEGDEAEPGDDLNGHNKIVRTFDSVTYDFNVNMKSYDSYKSYNTARIKFEFVLPVSFEQAVFDEASMTWMDRTEGYAPVTTTETRTIDGEEKECQVLTCYAYLEPSSGGISVVPGNYGQNVTIKVKSMKNGETFAPIISAAMEHSTWEGECKQENHIKNEKKTIIADEIRVTAAPKYNIQLRGDGSYKDTFDFTTGTDDALNKVDENGKIVGRVMKLGITLQLYNNNRSKGLKGIELPDCTKPIQFDLLIDSKYHINQPAPGTDYQQGNEVSINTEYMPLGWSYDFNHGGNHGEPNADGRQIFETQRCQGLAPIGQWGGQNGCYKGGDWKVTQEGTILHVEIKDYQVDVERMPLRNADWGDIVYGSDIGIGCFSAGQIWIVQPYNKKETGDNQGPDFDIVKQYGQGSFRTMVEAVNLKMTTLSGTEFADDKDTNNKQIIQDDDRYAGTLELTLPGSLQNRVRYADATDYASKGAGTDDVRDGNDYATVGSEIRLGGGFTYHSNGEEENQLYWGTNLTKFYGRAIEPVQEGENYLAPVFSGGVENTEVQVKAYYATKRDGEDWNSDEEMKCTYEDDLVFYENMSEIIKKGDICVGILYCFKGPGTLHETASHPEYKAFHRAKVKDDMNLAGNAYMLISTSRVWTKEMFEQGRMNLDNIPNWSESSTKLSSFPNYQYLSANIEGSVWYTKEEYAPDGSGILGKHNSDWEHWGDTLLIIGHKTGITKHLLQQSGTHTKDTFNLDTDQRVVDFKLQPRVYYDNKEGIGNNKVTATTVEVVDILPKHLTYVPGSAYIGGEYKQTAANGGMQGTIEGGQQKDPVIGEITEKINDESVKFTTLKWTFENVNVGDELPPIYYSANIGTRGNADTDVPTGSTSLVNRVYITSQYDRRAHTITNGNYAEVGISVTRGSASSFGKYTLQNVAEEDGEIDYVVYYNNNAQTDTSVDLMDTMPANGIAGSHFTGSYTFAGWKLDVSVCDRDKIQIFYSTDEKYKNQTIQDVASEGWKTWTPAVIGEDGMITLPETTPTAWIVTGQLALGQIVKIDLKLRLNPDPSATDKKENNFYINRLSSGETTVTTKTPTVRRTLEGLTWMDYNRNGIQDEEETGDRISGVKVELLKLREGGDVAAEADYEPVYYPVAEGSTASPKPIFIQTGQQISLRSPEGTTPSTYETGRYRFLDLPDGIYAVRFSSGADSSDISQWRATGKDLWSNDEIDSDAEPTYENDRLQKTVILGIVMKDAETMYQEKMELQESKYHDSGFYPNTELNIQKKDESGRNLSGASFTITDSDGRVLSFTEEDGTYKAVQLEDNLYESESSEETLSGALYYVAHANQPNYVLSFADWEAVLQERKDTDNQKFEIIPQGDGSFAFKKYGDNRWLNISGGVSNVQIEGADVIGYEHGGNPEANEKWYMRANKNGSIRIQAQAAGSGNAGFLDISGGSIQENQNIQIWTGNSTEAQNWKLIPAKNADGTESTLTVSADGRLHITNLIPGEYTITEMISPTGYALLEKPVKIQVGKDGKIYTSDGTECSNYQVDIMNYELYELPSAGGIGIYWYTISGALLMMASLLVLYKKKYAGRC